MPLNGSAAYAPITISSKPISLPGAVVVVEVVEVVTGGTVVLVVEGVTTVVGIVGPSVGVMIGSADPPSFPVNTTARVMITPIAANIATAPTAYVTRFVFLAATKPCSTNVYYNFFGNRPKIGKNFKNIFNIFV